MKRKITLLFIVIVMISSQLMLSKTIHAQTAGILTCTYTTVSSGGYTPKNCLAAWIETSSGTFIKTKFKYCSNSNIDHLTTWSGKSAGNVVDATTGSTRTVNGAMTLLWNGTDVASAIVADGVYKVWIEFSWASSLTTGKTTQSFSFTKGATADHQLGTATANLTGITLDWAPAVGISEIQDKEIFSVSPNPITSESTINYSLSALSDVTISLYDICGKLVDVLIDDMQYAGSYSLPLSRNANLKAGIYFVKMNTGKTQHTSRILITE